MGESRCRRAAQQQPGTGSGLSFAEIDRLMGEDPEDRAVREAHGFTYDDDFEDRSLMCRNGCGASYFDIVTGKVRECSAAGRAAKVNEVMDVLIPESGNPLDLTIEMAALLVTGRDGNGQPTPTVRELAGILSALPEQFQELPVARYCDEGISGVVCELGYEPEERDPDPRMSKYALHIRLW